jgi:predicted TPR repeat methyltransferase
LASCITTSVTTGAAAYFERALPVIREVGDRYHEADTLVHLGDARHAAGEHAAAETAWRDALKILDLLGHTAAAKVRARLQKSTRQQPTDQ